MDMTTPNLLRVASPLCSTVFFCAVFLTVPVDAQARVCVEDSDLPQRVGAIVLHLMLDYRVLPFIASDTPYEQLIRDRVPAVADPWSQDIEVVIYGWGYRRPLFASGLDAWALDQATSVRLRVYDVRGRLVRTLVDGMQPGGTHAVSFEAGRLPSGTYFYRLESPEGAQARQMMLVR